MNESIEQIPAFFQFLASMGVGGVLAYLMFRQNDKNLKDHADTIKGFYEAEKTRNESERARTDMLLGVIMDNTRQTTTNTEVLKSLHRRLDKDAAERS